MLKLTKDKAGSKITEAKFDLRNFGADIVYVINDPLKPQRRFDFDHAWSHFTGFDYVYIDAVTPNDFDLDILVDKGYDGDFHLGRSFYDIYDICLTKEILAIAFSHFKAYKQCSLSSKNRFLILEDDARPTKELMSSIYEGEFKTYIEGIKKRNFDWLFLGTADTVIKGHDYNSFLKRPENFTGLAAHAVLYSKDSIDRLVENHSKVEFAADLFLHYLNDTGKFSNVYSTYTSWISQVNYGKFLSPDHPDFEYSCGSQVNPDTQQGAENYPTISKEIMKHIQGPFETQDGYEKITWKPVPSLL